MKISNLEKSLQCTTIDCPQTINYYKRASGRWSIRQEGTTSSTDSIYECNHLKTSSHSRIPTLATSQVRPIARICSNKSADIQSTNITASKSKKRPAEDESYPRLSKKVVIDLGRPTSDSSDTDDTVLPGQYYYLHIVSPFYEYLFSSLQCQFRHLRLPLHLLRSLDRFQAMFLTLLPGELYYVPLIVNYRNIQLYSHLPILRSLPENF